MSVGPDGPDLTGHHRPHPIRRGPRTGEVRVASRLDATPAAVWERVVSAAGINDEMRPFLRMRFPAASLRLDPDQIEPGESVGRCWLFLFGLIPFDYDDLTVIRIEAGRGFHERSRMLSQRRWEHLRTLEPSGQGGCLVVDDVLWEPRLGLPGSPLRPLIGWFFAHRHRRLRRRFGGAAVDARQAGTGGWAAGAP